MPFISVCQLGLFITLTKKNLIDEKKQLSVCSLKTYLIPNPLLSDKCSYFLNLYRFFNSLLIFNAGSCPWTLKLNDCKHCFKLWMNLKLRFKTVFFIYDSTLFGLFKNWGITICTSESCPLFLSHFLPSSKKKASLHWFFIFLKSCVKTMKLFSVKSEEKNSFTRATLFVLVVWMKRPKPCSGVVMWKLAMAKWPCAMVKSLWPGTTITNPIQLKLRPYALVSRSVNLNCLDWKRWV